ncbi:hypothetical protein MUO32_08760 [Shinella sp. CPCC 101442]|uniref:hypothetical protein n=1 Tax=Shinella sp. CPCC 101442 TaxID=2932265 RepID=UPI0021526182|nr:hypothetical protein [Shinella sp. CPCC 101442]MCR6499118.1 hypothetical protein [Shinella sp. CPCC 101442]
MTIRRFLGISLLAIVAGCNQTDKPADLGVSSDTSGTGTQPAVQQTQGAVVQGACPQVYLRDGTAVLRRFAKGAKDDPSKLLYQVTLAETTRRCVINESQLVMTVMVQGRIVVGPAGTAGGTVNVPIRVAAADGNNTLFSDLVQFPVNIPAEGTAQFVFTKDNVAIPGGSGGFVRAFVGFDEGPYNTK